MAGLSGLMRGDGVLSKRDNEEGISFINASGVQGWRSGESTRLPSLWPGFDSQIRRQMWVE